MTTLGTNGYIEPHVGNNDRFQPRLCWFPTGQKRIFIHAGFLDRKTLRQSAIDPQVNVTVVDRPVDMADLHQAWEELETKISRLRSCRTRKRLVLAVEAMNLQLRTLDS